MTQFANHGTNSLNPNMLRNSNSINRRGHQITLNHRICQSGDKTTINRKKNNSY